MRFDTKSGSIYDVNIDAKHIRREGKPYGDDGKQRLHESWRTYENIYVRVGEPAIIQWPAGTPRLDDGEGPFMPITATSVVTEVFE